jgi:hypothetical protein
MIWKTPFDSSKKAPNGTPTFDPQAKRVYAVSFDGNACLLQFGYWRTTLEEELR